MDKTPHEPATNISEVLAGNLAALMEERGVKQAALAAKSGVAQTTISLYLNPKSRKPSARGKVPSGKIAEVEALAKALDVQLWELLCEMSPAERQVHRSVSAAIAKAGDDKRSSDSPRFSRLEKAPPGKRRAA